MKRARFQPRSMLALDPRAWGFFFDAPNRDNERRGDVVLVNIRGPLMHHEDFCFDSYDAIKDRVLEALAEEPKAVVLCIDSPGGLASGAFDTAEEIKGLAALAGIPLYAYVDGSALSAAYALACAASRIALPPAGVVGSIGVIEMMVDATAADAMFGVRTELVTSGARKADGNPHAALTEDAIAATRVNVDALAGVFFDHVAAARGIASDEVRSMQAAVVTGARAVPALADEIASLDQMLASIAGGTFGAAPEAAGDPIMPAAKASKGYEEAIAALRKAADSDDEKEAKRAKRMLAAELEGDEPDGDEGGSAEGGEEEPPKKDDEEDKEAKALAPRVTKIEEAIAAQAQASENLERKSLLASRPDLDEATKKLLATAPLADVREYVEKAPRKALRPAATAVVGATRAAGQTDEGESRLPPDEKRVLDMQMGLHVEKPEPRLEGNRQVFPALTRRDATAWHQKRTKAQSTSTEQR